MHDALFHNYLQAHMHFIVFTHDIAPRSVLMGMRKMRILKTHTDPQFANGTKKGPPLL